MATIHDVARLANASISTVSLAINEPERVSAKKREAIQEAILELGYVVKCRPKSTRQSVVLVSNSIGGPYFTELINGIQQTLAQQNIDLILLTDYNIKSSETQQFLSYFMREGVYSAVIVLGMDMARDAGLEPLLKKGAPVVLVDCENGTSNCGSVTVDNFSIGSIMAMHLISLGYTRIAVMGDRVEDKVDRQAGFLTRLSELGFPVSPELIWGGSYTEISGQAVINSFIESKQQLPQVIFCLNDEMAIGAISALNRHNYHVPQDIAVTGCDDIMIARYFNPTLTTVSLPKAEQGILVANQVVRALSGNTPENIVLSGRLIVRESCGSQMKRRNYHSGDAR